MRGRLRLCSILLSAVRLLWGASASSISASDAASSEDLTPHPIIFMGGLGASALWADLNKTSSPHWYCDKQDTDYKLWLYFENLAPLKVNCWLDNLHLKWHAGQPEDFGVKIKLPGDEASRKDIKDGFAKDLWSDLLHSIADLGYRGDSPHVGALHYDWRLSPIELEADGTFAKMKGQIEAFVTRSNGKKVILVTLSYAGPLMHKFLASFVDPMWKSKHVERWISLSGTFGGSSELTRMAFYPEPVDFYHVPSILPYISLMTLRSLSNTFPSSFVQRPAFLDDDEVLLNVSSSNGPRLYRKTDIAQALGDSGLDEAKSLCETHDHAYDFHSLAPPGVQVDCLFGTGDDTISSMNFGNGFNQKATAYRYEDGDGVAPTRSLSKCAMWNQSNAEGVKSTSAVSIYELPHVGHGGTLHSEAALHVFSEIIHNLHRRASGATSIYV